MQMRSSPPASLKAQRAQRVEFFAGMERKRSIPANQQPAGCGDTPSEDQGTGGVSPIQACRGHTTRRVGVWTEPDLYRFCPRTYYLCGAFLRVLCVSNDRREWAVISGLLSFFPVTDGIQKDMSGSCPVLLAEGSVIGYTIKRAGVARASARGHRLAGLTNKVDCSLGEI
jgi:hypothetical protein